MIYYVILSIDVEGNITNRVPRSMRHIMTITETESETEGVKHRKMCGWLNQRQFDRLVRDTDIVAQHIDTMGSTTEHGWMPAICFQDEYCLEYQAYVTPYPQKYKRSKRLNKRPTVLETRNAKQWDRLRKAVIRRYE